MFLFGRLVRLVLAARFLREIAVYSLSRSPFWSEWVQRFFFFFKEVLGCWALPSMGGINRMFFIVCCGHLVPFHDRGAGHFLFSLVRGRQRREDFFSSPFISAVQKDIFFFPPRFVPAQALAGALFPLRRRFPPSFPRERCDENKTVFFFLPPIWNPPGSFF